MHANNEVGAIQPIESIAELVQERRATGQNIYFHSDGVQSFGKMDVDLQRLGVDLYSISAHKLFGPKGVGGLFVRRGTPLGPVQFGGRHERGRRPGTENVPAAIAFARAVQLCKADDFRGLAALRDFFESEITCAIPGLTINGAASERLPNTSNVLFPGLSAEALVIALDMKGVAVSTGSACSSGSIAPSHVLMAMGLTPDEARSCVRFSFGRYNTSADVIRLVEAVSDSVSRLRIAAREEAHLAV
jgi:cysteine desulfurase